MARRKRARRLAPRKPARIRRKPKQQRPGSRPHGRTDPQLRSHHRPELLGLTLVALGLFLGALLYAGWSGGVVGGALKDAFLATIGALSYVMPVAFVVLGALTLASSRLVDVRPFRSGLVTLPFGILLALGGAHGGYVGRGLERIVSAGLGSTGTVIVAALLTVAGVLLVTGASVGAWVRRSREAFGHARSRRPRQRSLEAWPGDATTVLGPPPLVVPAPQPIDAEHSFPDVVGEGNGPPPLLVEHEPGPDEEPTLFKVEPLRREYRLPDAGILHRSPAVSQKLADSNERVADVLVQTLANFGVEAHIVGQISGPRVIRYELQLAPGTKVAKVAALKDDLSYALATTEIRILAPIPGKQAVGVEVPNQAPNLVTLGDIFDELPAAASPLAVWLGKDISGNAVWTDLARLPHVLIAGTTGSGKSGCINAILSSILLRATPDEVRMILVDPKRVELGFYESIPHLLTPVVSSPKEASAVLANLMGEMDRRYERMSIVRARSLPELNRALRQRGEDPLPYLLIVVDELADLMMTSPQAVEDAIIRLAQKSRAVGIHLVLATQRPSVDVITGMIKANIPSRIAFAVFSQTDSRVILDQPGAESLLGQGDMLFKPLGTSRLQRLQGAYVTEDEISLIVEQCRAQRGQQLDSSLLELPEAFADEEGGEDEEFDPDEDPLLEKAIEIVVQTQTASVSLIQRRLRVGYTRAGRLIDMLERRGIISGYEGSKPRRVLVDEAELDRILAAQG
jgi:S-DNA-T family DNA segregation ATPase FtsK/SpoIIIE